MTVHAAGDDDPTYFHATGDIVFLLEAEPATVALILAELP